MSHRVWMIDRRTRGLLVSHGRAGRDRRKKKNDWCWPLVRASEEEEVWEQVVQMAVDRSQVMSGYESSNKEKHAGSLNPCHTVVSLGLLLSVPKTTLHPSLLFFCFSSVEHSFQSQHEKQPHWSGAAGAPEQWKWMFCHLLSLRCHTRVSSDWLERGLPWPSTYWVKRM